MDVHLQSNHQMNYPPIFKNSNKSTVVQWQSLQIGSLDIQKTNHGSKGVERCYKIYNHWSCLEARVGAASIMINIPLVTTGSRWCDCVCSYQEQGDMPLPRSRTPHRGTQGEGSHGTTRLKLRYSGAKRCDFAPTSTI